MQNSYLGALFLQLADDRDYTAKAAPLTVFDSPDTIGIVQVYKGEPRRFDCSRLGGRGTRRNNQNRWNQEV